MPTATKAMRPIRGSFAWMKMTALVATEVMNG